ncbi:MAG: gliding motility-associated C-terminal domain-containing protein [Bacteroidia bacterium]
MAKRLIICLLVLLAQLSFAQCPQINSTVTFGIDCLTGKATMSVQVTSGVPPYSFTWSPSVSTTSVASNLNSGIYNVTIKDGNNCPGFTQGIINVNTLLTLNMGGPFTQSVSCNGGSDGIITATLTGNAATPPITYTWNTSSNSPTLSGVPAGIYTLSAEDSKGCIKTGTYQVTEPPPIHSSVNASVACFGGNVTSAITTTGGVAPFTYSLNGAAIPSNSVSISAGTYTLTTKDNKGCLKNNVITINQPAAPVFNFNIIQPSCPTSSNGAVSVSVTNLSAPLSYTWSPVLGSGPTLNLIPKNIYTVTIKDCKNCIASSVVTVNPVSNIQTTITTTPENCSAADGAATVNVSGGSLPLTFSLNNLPSQPSNTFSGLNSGLQSLTIFDASGCSLATTFSIGNTSNVSVSILGFTPVLCYNQCDGVVNLSVTNAVPPISYSLTGMPSVTINPIINICAGDYTIRATDNLGCWSTTTISFANPPFYSYSVGINSSAPICIGQSATLNSTVHGGTTPYSYSWSPGGHSSPNPIVTPSITTNYSLNVFDANGCTLQSKTITVNVFSPLTVSVSNQNSGICPGTTAQITPSVSGGDGNYSYQWLPGNQTTPSIFIDNISIPQYTFVVNDGCGSNPVSKIITLQLFPQTIPSFTLDTTSGCTPLCISFSNTTLKSTKPIWNFGDRPFEFMHDAPSYCYQNGGLYSVKLSVIDSNACFASFTATNIVNALARPKPNFITKPTTLIDTEGQGELINSSLNSTSVHWFVDDIDYGTANSITVNFFDTICFITKIISYNNNGCYDSLMRKVCVKPGVSFYMPNTFTPNDDGLNDVLFPFGNSILSENYSFKIYNRWGQKLFHTHQLNEGWDGKYKNNKAPNDIYYWIIEFRDFYEKDYIYKGHVFLQR